MSPPLRWDAAAARTRDLADALLEAEALAWFEAACRPFAADPGARFERLVRDCLRGAVAGDAVEPLASPRAEVAGRRSGRPVQAHAPALPPSASGPWEAARAGDQAPAPVQPPRADPALPRRPTAAAPAATGVAPARRTALTAAAGPGVAALPGRGAAAAATAGRVPPIGRVVDAPELTALPASPAPYVQFDRNPAAVASFAELASAGDPAPAAARSTPTPTARVLDWPHASPLAADRELPLPGAEALRATTIAAPAQATAEPPRPATESRAAVAPTAARSGRMRLVSGLPALQGLLHSTLAESQARHAPAPVDPARWLPAVLAAAESVPPPRVWPALDDLTEAMLVDRLADRLDERLREQALRHLGFTGGLI